MRLLFQNTIRALSLSLLLLTAGSSQEQNPTRLIGEETWTQVRAGQSLYDIARQEGYALEHLSQVNGLPINLAPLQVGKVLIPGRRVVPRSAPKQGLVVNLCERGFYVLDHERDARFFPVAIGKPGRFETPVGRFSVREKVVDPEWIAPDWADLGEDNVVPAGPNNPLGDRWIGLTSSGLGMHSTNNPSSIGSASSHGCMRMYPEVARTVFELVETGWPVQIVYESSSISLEKSGVYVAIYDDPYKRADYRGLLNKQFQELDLSGFLQVLGLDPLLEMKRGRVHKVVDFDVSCRLSSDESFPAARLAERLYLEQSNLEALNIVASFHLSEKKAVLRRDKVELEVPLFLPGSELDDPQAPFSLLARGKAWFPAKQVLQAFAIDYEWQGQDSVLEVRN